MPDMGMTTGKISEAAALYASASLSDALFSGTQRRVLACLFGTPGRSFTVSELIHATRSGSGAVQREVARLAGSGLLTITQVGNQKHYRSNQDCPIHDELTAIVRKTFGLAAPLQEALAPLASRIDAAFVYGSVAKGADTANSDIDLMVIADELDYAALYGALVTAETALGRPVSPSLMTPKEWRRKRRNADSFTARIADQPKLFVIGSEDELS